jgi:hypothetical protein
MGYTMTADEVTYWQDQAALLDPDAYEWHSGNSVSMTVTAGETWYIVNGWNLKATGAGTTWYHRPADVNRALACSAGTVIETTTPPDGTSTAFVYVCKPSLVTGGDSRYTDDPRALYFERLELMATLTRYRLGGVATGAGTTAVSFPGGFTDGLIVHVSVHDVAWMILRSSGVGASNLHNEISDSNRIRWAEPLVMPFKPATFDDTLIQGVSQSEGRATLTYLKLDGSGW